MKLYCQEIMSSRAVERLSTNFDFVADGSRTDALPTISGKHKDLKTISSQTANVTDSIHTHLCSEYIYIYC